MTTYMTAINLAYERKDRRKFIRRRPLRSRWSSRSGLSVLARCRTPDVGPPLERSCLARRRRGGSDPVDLVDRAVADPDTGLLHLLCNSASTWARTPIWGVEILTPGAGRAPLRGLVASAGSRSTEQVRFVQQDVGSLEASSSC